MIHILLSKQDLKMVIDFEFKNPKEWVEWFLNLKVSWSRFSWDRKGFMFETSSQ